jgi:hypothetical protein
MKKLSFPLMAALLLVLPFSCSNTNTDTKNAEVIETPEALEGSGSLNVGSFSRWEKGNLVHELYVELAAKTPELKKLDDDMDAMFKQQQTLHNNFTEYDAKSDSYYATAQSNGRGIADSTLRARLQQLIKASEQKYDGLTNELKALNKQIATNNTGITDQYAALQVVLTLPLMEKYQKQHLPAKKDYNAAIAKQNKTLKQIDVLNTAW